MSQEDLETEHFKYLCEMTRHFNDKVIESFVFYVQTLALIIGGSIWLAIQNVKQDHIQAFRYLSDGTVWLLTFITLARISENVRSWNGYRTAQNQVLPSVPLPKTVRASITEGAMMLGVLAAAILFSAYNPFGLVVKSN
jgi:hypothetical protein